MESLLLKKFGQKYFKNVVLDVYLSGVFFSELLPVCLDGDLKHIIVSSKQCLAVSVNTPPEQFVSVVVESQLSHISKSSIP